MTKRIKHISELPDWFDLKKYNGAKKLHAAGWYEQLEIRKCCTSLLELAQKNDAEDIRIKNEWFYVIRKNPIANIPSREELSTYFKDKDNKLRLRSPSNHTATIYKN